jgi:hypothetical protein
LDSLFFFIHTVCWYHIIYFPRHLSENFDHVSCFLFSHFWFFIQFPL